MPFGLLRAFSPTTFLKITVHRSLRSNTKNYEDQ